ncbi:class I SAM-dependent methyltransferase [Bacillus sp. EB93]|uniref:class I SAM-dependent methyltransferase n=1 Tax=Peribacillus frigoritolerans TaxID=450367 RepID=UPI001379991E|nr:class I SAM-dependent methyltransferase [Peribacillus frigoritolerans]MCT1390004.1 class I SAM-dependent methyltransferase [Peribacillus frigoritolerans]NCT36452.1 class I SAM-dependent methyltransferase [Peribacillus frigoritolerans]
MNNSWNKVIYKFWSPVYDKIFNSHLFLDARKRLFEELDFHDHAKVLFVGVGTGADLELIKNLDLEITAIDLSADMLKKAMGKFDDASISFLEMDAQHMEFANESFDYVVGSLVLSVVSDANECLREMIRVVKGEGKIILFDKFISKDERLSVPKKLLRPIIRFLGTDIGLRFEDLFSGHEKNMEIEEDRPIMLNGMYRKIIISKRL